MAEPVMIIDSSDIREGKLEELKTAMNELAQFVEGREPKAIAYNVYFNADGTRMTVFRVHPDSASVGLHMQVAGSAFREFLELLKLSGIDIYGKPSDGLLERLRQKSTMLGSGIVAVHELRAGFTRFGGLSPDALDLP